MMDEVRSIYNFCTSLSNVVNIFGAMATKTESFNW